MKKFLLVCWIVVIGSVWADYGSASELDLLARGLDLIAQSIDDVQDDDDEIPEPPKIDLDKIGSKKKTATKKPPLPPRKDQNKKKKTVLDQIKEGAKLKPTPEKKPVEKKSGGEIADALAKKFKPVDDDSDSESEDEDWVNGFE